MLFFSFCTTLVTLPFFISNAIATPGFGSSSQYDDAVRHLFKRKAPPSPAVTVDLKYFSTLPASETLKWVSCYGDAYFCARLKVPLDYSKPERGTVKLALVKLPARKHKKYKGALYLQVGLGVSSTNLVLQFGPAFQRPDLEGYDIIGWDVRGIGQTTPALKCFPDEVTRRAFVDKAPKILGDPSLSLEDSIKENLVYAKELGAACKKYSCAFLPWYDTPNNARDLHTIVAATGAKKLAAFWGYQYATLIGETYASLYPHGYKHLILDGVIHGEKAYGFGDVKPSSIRDAEKTFGVFFDSCAKAGPKGCSFYAETADLVRARYDALEAKLIKFPIPVKGFPDGFGYSALHRLLSLVVTDTNDLFPFLASVLVEAESGVAGDLINFLIVEYPLSPVVNDNEDGSFEYTTAIQCLDSDPYHIDHPKEFVPYLKSMLRESEAVGFSAASRKLNCAGWSYPRRS